MLEDPQGLSGIHCLPVFPFGHLDAFTVKCEQSFPPSYRRAGASCTTKADLMMKLIFRGFLVILIAFGLWLTYALNNRPDLSSYEKLWLPKAEAGGLRLTNLGVSTLLISDGETSFMTDGFFSRPGMLKVVAGKLTPDQARISEGLARAGVEQLVAVLVVHSHYDHVMDSAEVAKRTGAVLVGSQSTANVGRGSGLAEDRLIVVEGGETLRFGKFRISMIKSQHFPHGKAMGEISEPLTAPARATAYQEGGSYSILVEHPQGSLLIQGSAGFVEGALDGKQADVVLLGVGLLGSTDEQYMQAYWRETVQAVGARRVIPIHWDDFFKPWKEKPKPFPFLLDNLDASMQFIQSKAKETDVDVRLAPAWHAVYPFVEAGELTARD